MCYLLCYTLLEINDGLFEPLVLTQLDSDIQVSWEPVPLNKQTAFIQGYILYWSDFKHPDIVFNVSTGKFSDRLHDATELE